MMNPFVGVFVAQYIKILLCGLQFSFLDKNYS